LAVSPGTTRTAVTGALDHAGVVGDCPAFSQSLFVNPEQQGGGEELRRLRSTQGFARGRGQDQAVFDLFDRVRDGNCGNDAADLIRQSGQKGVDEGGREKGTCAVVDQDSLAIPGQGGQAHAYGVLPAVPAGNGQDADTRVKGMFEFFEFGEAQVQFLGGENDDHAHEARYR
jgi:hypothetical protein